MILTQISYLDCVVFIFFLIPQLLLNVNIIKLITCGLRMVPFFCEINAFKMSNSKGFNTALSNKTSIIFHNRTLLYPSVTSLALRPAGHSISGLCYQMRAIRICKPTRHYRSRVLLQERRASLLYVSPVPSWLCAFSHSMARD